MYQKKIIISDDGSHTIELIGMNEQYHSTHGAIQESNHVYIKHGLERISKQKNSLNVLEVGMGTGLNVLLTWAIAMEQNLQVYYQAIEAYPISQELWSQLNYTQLLDNSEAEQIFKWIHSTPWNDPLALNENFTFLKKEALIQDSILPDDFFDVVYFDAFNPDLEPGLWTEEVFKKIYKSMSSPSVLSTYSTKGIVKRALKASGFVIEKKPGPSGKREILNALKNPI